MPGRQQAASSQSRPVPYIVLACQSLAAPRCRAWHRPRNQCPNKQCLHAPGHPLHHRSVTSDQPTALHKHRTRGPRRHHGSIVLRLVPFLLACWLGHPLLLHLHLHLQLHLQLHLHLIKPALRPVSCSRDSRRLILQKRQSWFSSASNSVGGHALSGLEPPSWRRRAPGGGEPAKIQYHASRQRHSHDPVTST